MRTQLSNIVRAWAACPLLTAALALAMAFAFSCSSDKDDSPPPPVVMVAISSSDGGSSSGDGGSSSGGGIACATWGAWATTTAPTCEAAGVETRACTSGNSSPEMREIAQLVWGGWSITSHATQNAHGVETRTCPTTPPTTQTRELLMCGTVEYDPDEFCQSLNVVRKRCNGATYTSAQVCCNGSLYAPEAIPTREHYGIAKAQFCDERDGKMYVKVSIDDQTWMAENLNYAASGSKCYGEGGGVGYYNGTNYYPFITIPDADIQANCNKYGRLYNWATAKSVYPSGWHIPNNAEWDKLMHYVDGVNSSPACASTSVDASPYCSNFAGRYLKATSGWNSGSNGEDTHGFSALPGGSRLSNGNSFNYVGRDGYWWSNSEDLPIGGSYAWNRVMQSEHWRAEFYSRDKSGLYSVRCLKD